MIVAIPPKAFLTSCYVSPPPTEAELLDAHQRFPEVENEWEARFLLMNEHWTEQTQSLGNCNWRISLLKAWGEEQKALQSEL